MLVPLVLRSIVLPYLRTAAINAAARPPPRPTTPTSAAISTSARSPHPAAQAQAHVHNQAVEEPYSQPWPTSAHPFHLSRHHSIPPKPPPMPLQPRPLQLQPRLHPHLQPRPAQAPTSDSASSSSVTGSHQVHTVPLGAPKTGPVSKYVPVLDASRRAKFEARFQQTISVPKLPPSVHKLLKARLFRMTVFHVLATPEYASDAPLVEHIADHLEKGGAGKLASRLRYSLKIGLTRDGKLRLLSEPKHGNEPAKPPDHWKLPLTKRDVYSGETATERKTHYFNLQLTRLLSKPQPIPYSSPFPRFDPTSRIGNVSNPPLRRLQDVLHHIHVLREQRDFVPDRVTANIVIKCWLMSLARGTDGWGQSAMDRPGRKGLNKDELRDLFELVAASMENGACAAMLAGDDDVDVQFDSRIDHDRHVEPFANMMNRAMTRIGDHAGRKRVLHWLKTKRREAAAAARVDEGTVVDSINRDTTTGSVTGSVVVVVEEEQLSCKKKQPESWKKEKGHGMA